MRTPKDASERWHNTFANASDISALRADVHHSDGTSPTEKGLRSVCWKAFLLFENLDRSTWPKIIQDSRSAYSSLQEHFLTLLRNPDTIGVVDPLADDDRSPWNTLRQDELLRAEIFQDIERCMQENPFFRESSTQNALLDILFIFCKLNADVGYRQGMHELLAPIYWVTSQDALDTENLEVDDDDALMHSVLDHNFVEHDAFTLFCIVMQTAKSFYETTNSIQNASSSTGPDPHIVARSRRIYNYYLKKTDRELLEHLTAIDILPQIFVLRWIRLLFGREFPFEHVLSMWDVLFAEDPRFEIIDLVCVAMLLRIRWLLLDADYTSALTLLLRYPLPFPPHGPMTLIEDALYLRNNLTAESGSELISKHTDRTPLNYLPEPERKGRSLHTPKTSSDNTSRSPLRSPSQYIHESGGLEAMLQGAAKGVYKRSQKLGLNQALRGAVQQLQSVNNSPRKYISAARRSMEEGRAAITGNQSMQREIQDLEARNRVLARMIQEAIEELNEQADKLEESKATTASRNLTLTVAKLQFAHVYLDNPSLPIDDAALVSNSQTLDTINVAIQETKNETIEDEETISWSPVEHDHRGRPASTIANQIGPSSSVLLPRPILESPTRKYIPGRRRPPAQPLDQLAVKPSAKPPYSTDTDTDAAKNASSSPQKPRPSLAHSSFSWMLGTEADRSGYSSNSPFASDHEQKSLKDKKTRGKASFLFGDDFEAGTLRPTNSKEDSREDEDGFTLGTLRGVKKESSPSYV